MNAIFTQHGDEAPDIVALPSPPFDDGMALNAALSQRRSVRHFTDRPIDLNELAELLWAAQGVTAPAGHRTAPSAGALYPLDIQVIAQHVSQLSSGTYCYLPERHALRCTGPAVPAVLLRDAVPGQDWMLNAAVFMVITAVYDRTTPKYGARGERYVCMEVGHVAQNACLQATSLGLGTTVVGSFRDKVIADIVETGVPLCLLPIGRI